MNAVSQRTTWKLGPGVRFRRVLDEGVVVHLEAGEIVGTNDVGARILELIAERPDDASGLAERLAEEYHEATGAHEDVPDFLAELEELGVVERSERRGDEDTAESAEEPS